MCLCARACACPVGCQSFQGKSLPCQQSELISYPLERSVHDALPNPPLNGKNPHPTEPCYQNTLERLRGCHHRKKPYICEVDWLSVVLSCAKPFLCLPSGLVLAWPVLGAQTRPDRQTAFFMGCPFFPLAQPVTQLQYKHSFLWATELL